MYNQLLIRDMVDRIERERANTYAQQAWVIRQATEGQKSSRGAVSAMIGKTLIRVGRLIAGETSTQPVGATS